MAIKEKYYCSYDIYKFKLIIQRLGEDFIIGYYSGKSTFFIWNYKTYEEVKIIEAMNFFDKIIVTQHLKLISVNS